MPSLLGNRKVNTLVVARQPQVEHFHGYAGAQGYMATKNGRPQEYEGQCFYWARQMLYREDKTQQESYQLVPVPERGQFP
jgi:hypothetical protein